MRRRRLLQSIAALPVVPAIPAMAQSAYPNAEEMPKLRETSPDAAGSGVPKFFTAPQGLALRRLADLIVPPAGERPGAVAAGVVEFLDFLIGQSEPARQTLYRGGLDQLNTAAKSRYGKAFAETSDAEAKPLLAPLSEPWTYNAPKDPVARFLKEAKEDLLQATLNSKAFADAASRRSRAAGGMGAYWLPLD